jgi:AcrR family transcriptional regulator
MYLSLVGQQVKMSPRTPQQFQEIREEKMTLIMDVALQQFANEGYYRTTISEIAKKAGISKGLMYNYFESKEALLRSIIDRSVNEIYKFFDANRDGHLTEDEFEFFIKKLNILLIRNRHFWQLMMQLLVQHDVMKKFFETFPLRNSLNFPGDNYNPDKMMQVLKDYFVRKKERRGEDYDPEVDINIFLITLKGLAVTSIYAQEKDDEENGKIINGIVNMFK